MNDNKQMSAVNRILKRNRRILQQIASQRGKKATRETLLQQGFNFDYFTGIADRKGVSCFCCYEYGYYEVREGWYWVVKP